MTPAVLLALAHEVYGPRVAYLAPSSSDGGRSWTVGIDHGPGGRLMVTELGEMGAAIEAAHLGLFRILVGAVERSHRRVA